VAKCPGQSNVIFSCSCRREKRHAREPAELPLLGEEEALAGPIVDALGVELELGIRSAAEPQHFMHLLAIGPEPETAQQVAGEDALALSFLAPQRRECLGSQRRELGGGRRRRHGDQDGEQQLDRSRAPAHAPRIICSRLR
jgi:hypothetical protein